MTWHPELDRSSPLPLYRQIAEAVRADVRAGRLGAGVKLPSTREIAKRLGVHRRTVVQAFRTLVEEGWLESGIGQGTFVREGAALEAGREAERPGEPAVPAPAASRPARRAGRFSWEAAIRRHGNALPELVRYWQQTADTDGMIRFTGATADPSFFPTGEFRRILDEVFRREGARALDYGPAEGIPSLREWVAGRLAARGVETGADRVLIVSGSQQGLDLIARLLLREGDSVAVEEPGYGNGFRLFQAGGARAAGVPLDAGGLRLDLLEEICRREAPRALYTMPNFQNPTGLSLDPDRVEPLLEICRRHQLPVVEDQFDTDLYYEGEDPSPVKARDRSDQVVLLGSFSKILFPGLRLGWLVVPSALYGPLRELKQLADFSSSLLAQHAVDLYCRRGLLDAHLERIRRIYGRRLEAMLQAMAGEFPPEVRWTRPRGGLTLWVSLPPGVDSFELLRRARARGVDFSPGPFFYPNGGGEGHLRLSYIRETEDRIREGMAILGALIRSAVARAPETSGAGPFF